MTGVEISGIAEQIEGDEAVGISLEDTLARVAALGHMIRASDERTRVRRATDRDSGNGQRKTSRTRSVCPRFVAVPGFRGLSPVFPGLPRQRGNF